MGVKVLKCFPWYNRRKERSKLAKSQGLEGAVTSMDSTRQTKCSSEGNNQTNRAFYSEKARVSFRHELDSATSVINSTN